MKPWTGDLADAVASRPAIDSVGAARKEFGNGTVGHFRVPLVHLKVDSLGAGRLASEAYNGDYYGSTSLSTVMAPSSSPVALKTIRPFGSTLA
jgi:hypothetical protein